MNRAILLLLTLDLSLAPVLCWAAERKTDEAKAIAEIEKLGGRRVTRDEKSPGRPVIGVSLEAGNVTDAGLVYLEGLTHLQVLNLSRTQVTGAGLAHIEGLTQLRTLDLSETPIAGSPPRSWLDWVRLLREKVPPQANPRAGLEYLKGLTKLQSLNLWETKVGNAGLMQLKGCGNFKR